MGAGAMDQTLQSIAALEAKTEEQLALLSQDINSLHKNLRNGQEKLYKRRQELVSGKALPSAEEAADWDADHPHLGAEGEQQHGATIKGVPYFWLSVLCNQDTIAEEISSRDKQALSYCTGVRAAWPAGGGPATLEASFAANPFFSDSVLRRCLGDEASGADEVTTDIRWKDASHNLTMREVIKKGGKKSGKGKGGKGGKGKGGRGSAAHEDDEDDEPQAAAAARVSYKPCGSLFSFFLPEEGRRSSGGGGARGRRAHHLHDPTLPHDVDLSEQEGDEPERSAKQERDELLMAVLLDEVLPRAAQLYSDGPLQAPSDDEDDGEWSVVHGAVGGSPSDLPRPVQRVLAALAHNQAQLDSLAAEWQAVRAQKKAAQSKLRAELGRQRRALLLPAGASEPAVPRFWLRVLRAADAAALAISPRDAAVLAALADVRFSLDGSEDGSELHGRLELEFMPNPYLAAGGGSGSGSGGGSSGGGSSGGATLVLSKAYSLVPQPGGVRMLQSKVVAAPKWAGPERDPTHKAASGRSGSKQRPAASIFQLFKAGGGKYAFNLTGDARDVQEEANELETELLQELHGHLLVRAGHVYQDLAAGGAWHEDDNEAGDRIAWDTAAVESEDEQASEEEGDEEDDEREAAHKAAVRAGKAKGSWRPTKAGILLILLGMILVGEFMVFLDMMGVFRRR